MPHSLSPFETLPPELRLLITSYLPISCLNSLIQTTSTFYHLLNSVLYQLVPPSFQRLPPNLVLKIALYLSSEPLNALTQTSSKLRKLLSPVLYKRDDYLGILSQAAYWGNWSLVASAISRGANLSSTSNGGLTALHWSADYGHEPSIVALLDAGAPIDPNNGWGGTPLMMAVRGGRLGVVRLLLDRGANVNARNKDGTTALHTLAELYAGSLKIARLLLKRGAEIDAERREGKETPLVTAAMGGHWYCARFLVRRGADVERRCIKRKTYWRNGVVPFLVDYVFGGRGLTVAELAAEEGVDLWGRVHRATGGA